MIEDWQYEALRARAEREGCSLSAALRGILEAALAAPANDDRGRLDRMAGIGEDPAAYGQDHDRYLYGDTDANASGRKRGKQGR